ncbi:MAG TPA: carboxypeptidase M32 [Rariglobus sp.]|jgi:carboxypeptidase Taq|nr:carboxypeptidase M32 [Rariglobus sp.]
MSDSYDRLVAKLKRAHVLGTVAGLLGWDEQVNLPADSADQRAEQMALLAELNHTAASDAEIGALLAQLEGNTSGLTSDQQVVVREARRDYDRVTKLPADFVTEKARLSSAAYHAWADAKAKSDFAAYAPYLEKHLALAKREAAYLGWSDRPYDYAIDKHDPGMTAAKITALFADLKTGLVPLVRAIAASPVKARTDIFKGFPVDAQRDFLREVTERLGFNYRRGRIDVSLHPFCEGSGADIRMTTRFDADNPLDSLFSSIHETGHGLYEQGLPLALQGTPLGQNAGMGVHESQSRLWENQVSRSRAFWAFFEPRFRDKFSIQLAAVSSEELYLAVNEVAPTLIRVDSDEVHYNLHVMLRFELERRLFAGELAVADLPAAWNALSQELLGLTPTSDKVGVLQDVHWSGGAFGYFPSYCLGNMIAAQLWFTVLKTLPDLEADFKKGDFSRLLGWLRINIHEQGRRYDTLALVKQVTGEELTPKYLLRYLQERYAPLYLK